MASWIAIFAGWLAGNVLVLLTVHRAHQYFDSLDGHGDRLN